jgi:dolichol-phosphate mannosyltransferase
VHSVSKTGSSEKLTLVVPTLYEAGNLPTLLQRIRTSLDPLGVEYEVIVVDDDSRDGTEQIVQEAAVRDSRVRLLVRRGVRGLAGAVIHGWAHSDAGILGVIDADLQHPPELLPDLWRALQAGADVVVASRYAPQGSLANWSRFRHLLSQVAIWMTWPLQRPGIRVRDPMSGFFLLRRPVIDGLDLHPYGFKILLEILVRGKVQRATEVPFSFGHRQSGKSKASLKVGLDYFRLLARLSRQR